MRKLRGQRPLYAEQSSAAAQTNSQVKKSRQKAKEKNLKKPPTEKIQTCTIKQSKSKSIKIANRSAAKRTVHTVHAPKERSFCTNRAILISRKK